MINIRTIRKLKDNDGLTLKNGKIITYKSGWQVADHGAVATTPEGVMQAIKSFKGNCGIWYAAGVYYIDHSFRVSTKQEALSIGRQNEQISIWGWKRQQLAYC